MKRRDARAEILAVLSDMEWHSAIDVQKRTGLSQAAVMDNLNRMSERPWDQPLLEKEVRLRTDGAPHQILPPRMRPYGVSKERSRVQRLVHYRLRKTGE